MAGSGIDRKTFWNVVAVAGLLIIVLAIGVFVVKTMTLNNNPGPTVGPTAALVNVTADPSLASTPAPTLAQTLTPTPSATVTPTPAPYSTPTPTPTPAPTLTPTPAPTFYPTQPPQATPTATPTPTPPPVQNIPDAPFYESITPLKDKDQFSLAPVENSYIAGNGPLYLDLDHSYMGSGYAYPGDTIGVKLKMYNDGPAMDTTARVTMSLSKMLYTDYGSIWSPEIISQEAYTPITVGEKTSFTKNISYAVPNTSGFKGFYKITVKYYVNGQFNCGFIKELNIMDP